MISIERITTPAGTLLNNYTSIAGAYTDCYTTEIARTVSLSEFVFTFYTTPLFKLERTILTFTVSKPSTDIQAKQVAEGSLAEFAAWTVESRRENELLMCDYLRRTRSWFMTKGDGSRTHLYFGSAVVPKTGETSLDFGYRALLGFHQIYSVLLLRSAHARLKRQRYPA